MKPSERRLMREIPAMRQHLVTTVAVITAVAAAIVAQASLLAEVIARGFTGHVTPLTVSGLLGVLASVVALRAGLSWAQTVLGYRAAEGLKADLRDRLLEHTQKLGPIRLAQWRHGELATLVAKGVDGLDPYFTKYLPKMVASMVVPVAVISWLAVADWTSALIIVVTLPLIPIFGVLVGSHTRQRTARQWGLLARFGGHFLDVVAGLPTLRAFGRVNHQVHEVDKVANSHRTATMRTLRVAFLSSLTLELVATLSVAVVAVPVGLRLMSGSLDLHTALLVLFLAPEAYLPLRAAGAAFHDSAEGIAVAENTFAVLDQHTTRVSAHTAPHLPSASSSVPDPTAHDVCLERVTATYPNHTTPAVEDVSLSVRAGERLALVGPSGAGKSTLLALLLGFLPLDSGRIRIGDTDLSEMNARDWRNQVAWVPQQPHLFAASVADNIRLGHPTATMREVTEAARAASAEEFIAELPHTYDTVLGERGSGISTGQRQRIALARAFLRDAPLLLLDEPTANLDPRTESEVAAATARLMPGRTTIIVAHRHALLAHADRVITVHDGKILPTTTTPRHLEPAQIGT